MYKYLLLFLTFTSIFFWGCQKEQQIQLSGTIDYVGSSELYLSKQAVHYKYADKKRFAVQPNGNGNFSLTIPVDSQQIIDFNIDDRSYPIVASPGANLNLRIYRSQFPDSVMVEGYPQPWDKKYRQYQTDVTEINKRISDHLQAFRDGKPTNIPDLYRQRYLLAADYFKDTPLDNIYYKTVGEYLVKSLEEIKYRREQPDFNARQQREQVLEEARNLDFFSFEALHAQRAGIRDFTNAFANTFGVADSLEQKYGQELLQYDVKRLGYPKLDSARTSVLKYISGRKAKAYAQMHLVAERIGEMPLEIARPGYQNYLKEYEDFPRYTSFLKDFYQQRERVSPGKKAIPFSLPNQNGEFVQMEDFEGKYVLLDFWASWCIPCLDEFPHMKEIYSKYPRDKFEIVAISIEEDSLRWRSALQRFKNPWPQLYGGKGFQQPTFKAYRGGGIPFYVLVGPEGKILRYNDVRPSFNLPGLLDSLIVNS